MTEFVTIPWLVRTASCEDCGRQPGERHTLTCGAFPAGVFDNEAIGDIVRNRKPLPEPPVPIEEDR